MEITDTITDVDEEEWNRLVRSDRVEDSYKWYKTVEESGIRKIYYVLLKENEKLQAAACCYSHRERMYNVEMPFLEVKSPLGKMSAFYTSTPEHTRTLIKGLEEVREKERAKGIMILDLKKEEYNTLRKHVGEFTGFPVFEDTYIDLNFKTFDDYLASLTEDAWRSARMTLNRARRWKIRTVSTNEFSQWKDVVPRLHRYVCEEHKDYRMYLTEKFYEVLEKNLKENAELLLFLKDDVPIASALALLTPEIALYTTPGVDPEYRKYQGYFLIYYEGIKKSIEKGKKRVYFGPTTYAFKEKIGCRKEELFGMVRMENPLLNLTFKLFLKMCGFLGKKF